MKYTRNLQNTIKHLIEKQNELLDFAKEACKRIYGNDGNWLYYNNVEETIFSEDFSCSSLEALDKHLKESEERKKAYEREKEAKNS